MTEWVERELRDLGQIITGKTPTSSEPEFYGGELPFVTPSDMDGRRTIDTTARKLTDAGVAKVKSSFVQEPAVCVSCIGSDMGKAVLVDQPFVSNQQINSVVVKEDVERLFVYYNLAGRKDEIRFKASGAAQPIMNKSDFGKLKLVVPKQSTQKLVAFVLGSFDDKFELNRRMNETLEAMARALFRDWFVDFGPTRRQMDGATDPAVIMGHAFPPQKAATLAPLFPAKLGNDGLPDGWDTRELRSALTLNYGKSLPKKTRNPGPYNVYGSGGITGTHDTALVKGPSIIVGRKGTVGSLYWSVADFFPIDTVFYVTSQHPMVFCHRLVETLGLETMNTDAAVPGLNRDNAYRQEFAYGGDKSIKAYAEFGDPLVDKADANEKENQTLAEMRDLLLPKLMSGEIRLKDAEEKAT
jgi:type I restriction enzyme S subunit